MKYDYFNWRFDQHAQNESEKNFAKDTKVPNVPEPPMTKDEVI